MIFDWLTQPLSAICLLLALTTLFALRGGGLKLAFFNLISCTLLWVLSTPELSNRWLLALESSRQNPSVCTEATVQHVVLLGGGMNPWIPNSTARQRLNLDSIERTTAAAQIGTADTRWYSQGAGANGFTLADDMASLLIEYGVDSAAIFRESTSTSTQENARNLSQILSPAGNTPIHLVTSALHVQRAADIFSREGYVVCHLPNIDSRYSVPAMPVSLLPYIGGLEKTTLAWREQLARLKHSVTR